MTWWSLALSLSGGLSPHDFSYPYDDEYEAYLLSCLHETPSIIFTPKRRHSIAVAAVGRCSSRPVIFEKRELKKEYIFRVRRRSDEGSFLSLTCLLPSEQPCMYHARVYNRAVEKHQFWFMVFDPNMIRTPRLDAIERRAGA